MSNNLSVTYIAPNQDQKEVTINSAIDEIIAAITNSISIATADANVTLTTGEAGQALGNLVFVFTGADTAARNVIVPTNKKLYIVKNSTTGGWKLTIKTSGGTGVDFLSTDGYKLVYCDGTNVVAVGGSGGGSSVGGVSAKTADYSILGTDADELLVLTTGSHTFTLPNPTPGATFLCFIANASSGVLTVARNSLTINGAASDLSLAQNEGVTLFTDGSNYFAVEGIGGGAGSSTLAGDTDVSLSSPSDGDLLTYETSSSLWKNKPSAGGGTPFQKTQRRATMIASGATGGSVTMQAVGDVFTEDTVGSKLGKAATSSIGAAIEYAPSGSQTILLTKTNYVTGRHIKLEWKGYFTTTGDGDLWIILTDTMGNYTLGLRADTPAAGGGNNYAGFRLFNRGGSGETTWHACNGDATSDTVTDTGVTQDTNEHTFAIVFDDDNSQILFYIDGVLKATNTTHLPTSGTPLGLAMSAWFASTSISIGIGSVIIDSDL